MTITVEIQKLIGHYITSWEKVMSLALIASIPVLALFAIFQDVFIKGFTAGGVKE